MSLRTEMQFSYPVLRRDDEAPLLVTASTKYESNTNVEITEYRMSK